MESFLKYNFRQESTPCDCEFLFSAALRSCQFSSRMLRAAAPDASASLCLNPAENGDSNAYLAAPVPEDFAYHSSPGMFWTDACEFRSESV